MIRDGDLAGISIGPIQPFSKYRYPHGCQYPMEKKKNLMSSRTLRQKMVVLWQSCTSRPVQTIGHESSFGLRIQMKVARGGLKSSSLGRYIA